MTIQKMLSMSLLERSFKVFILIFLVLSVELFAYESQETAKLKAEIHSLIIDLEVKKDVLQKVSVQAVEALASVNVFEKTSAESERLANDKKTVIAMKFGASSASDIIPATALKDFALSKFTDSINGALFDIQIKYELPKPGEMPKGGEDAFNRAVSFAQESVKKIVEEEKKAGRKLEKGTDKYCFHELMGYTRGLIEETKKFRKEFAIQKSSMEKFLADVKELKNTIKEKKKQLEKLEEADELYARKMAIEKIKKELKNKQKAQSDKSPTKRKHSEEIKTTKLDNKHVNKTINNLRDAELRVDELIEKYQKSISAVKEGYMSISSFQYDYSLNIDYLPEELSDKEKLAKIHMLKYLDDDIRVHEDILVILEFKLKMLEGIIADTEKEIPGISKQFNDARVAVGKLKKEYEEEVKKLTAQLNRDDVPDEKKEINKKQIQKLSSYIESLDKVLMETRTEKDMERIIEEIQNDYNTLRKKYQDISDFRKKEIDTCKEAIQIRKGKLQEITHKIAKQAKDINATREMYVELVNRLNSFLVPGFVNWPYTTQHLKSIASEVKEKYPKMKQSYDKLIFLRTDFLKKYFPDETYSSIGIAEEIDLDERITTLACYIDRDIEGYKFKEDWKQFWDKALEEENVLKSNWGQPVSLRVNVSNMVEGLSTAVKDRENAEASEKKAREESLKWLQEEAVRKKAIEEELSQIKAKKLQLRANQDEKNKKISDILESIHNKFKQALKQETKLSLTETQLEYNKVKRISDVKDLSDYNRELINEIGTLYMDVIGWGKDLGMQELPELKNLRIQNRRWNDIEDKLTVTKDDLINGLIEISGAIGKGFGDINKDGRLIGTTKLEINTGFSWQEIKWFEGSAVLNQWVFRFTPVVGAQTISIRAVNPGNIYSDPMDFPPIKLIYEPISSQSKIEGVLNKLKDTFERKDVSGFMKNVSDDFYGGSDVLRDQLRRFFDVTNTLRLYIVVDTYRSQKNRRFLDTHWERTLVSNSTSKQYKQSGYTTFVFDTDENKLLGMKGDSIFVVLSDDKEPLAGIEEKLQEQPKEQPKPKLPSGKITMYDKSYPQQGFSFSQGTLVDRSNCDFYLTLDDNGMPGTVPGGIVDLGSKDLDSITSVPTTGYIKYPEWIKAVEYHSYAVKTNDNKYGIFYIETLVSEYTSYIVFTWKYQPDSSTNFW